MTADLKSAGLPSNLESYGFDGGTFPPYIAADGNPITIIGSPQNGQPDELAPIGNLNQGIELDGFIAGQFEQWFSSYDPEAGPFATAGATISFPPRTSSLETNLIPQAPSPPVMLRFM